MTAARFRLIYAMVAGVVFSAAIFPSFLSPAATAQTGLFTEAARQPAAADSRFSPTIVRNRYVDVNFAQLATAARTAAGQASALQMDLFPFISELFPGISLTVVGQRAEPTRSGQGTIWYGKVVGEPDSMVILVVEGNVLVGNIHAGKGFYQIRYAGDGVHMIQQVNSLLYPDEQGAIFGEEHHHHGAAPAPARTATPVPAPTKALAAPASAPARAAASSNPAADNGSTIDVLVVYSQGSTTAAGGSTAINNLITLMEAETNQGYAQSNVIQRVRIVGRQEVVSAEGAGLNSYLTALENGTGAFTAIPGLRNSTGADLVYLIQNQVSDPCGLASMVLPSLSTSFAPQGYSAGQLDCSTGSGGWTFGHELGHLMGTRHDWASDPTNNSPFTYNHGYVQPGPNRSCDVMATRSACSNAGNARANYWSNPNVTVNGVPIGIPEGQTNAAENWKALNNTRSTISNFRTCTVSPCDVPPTVQPPATVPGAPGNDNFPGTTVGSLPANFNVNTANATLQAGEQPPGPGCGSGFGKSVWYSFTPAASGQVTVSTVGSSFDTILGIWTGGAIGSLTQVICNDDSSTTILQSSVAFNATAGTTYRIQVGGFSNASGNLVVNITGATTATNTPIPPATATRTATTIPTPVVNCNPRPRVTVNVQPIGGNTLQVTIGPGANGWINQIQIGAATNASINMAGQTGITGNQTINLPPATTSLTFQVIRSGGGSTTVPLTVVDTCGSWPTFVGGGQSAF
jgi:hypothetical protein